MPDSVKTQLLNQRCSGMEEQIACCVFLAGGMLQPHRFPQGEMTTLGLETPIPVAPEDISLQFQSYVNAFLGHSVLSMNVDFCISFCTDKLKLYC